MQAVVTEPRHILSRNMVSSVQKPSVSKCSQEASDMAGRAGICNIASNLSKSVAHTTNNKFLHTGSKHQNGIVLVSKCPTNVVQKTVSGPATEHKAPLPPKTEGGHTSDQSSLTDQSNCKRLVCPELAINYTNTLLSNRGGRLSSRQQDLEGMLSSLKKKLRRRQLDLVHSHASKQVEFHEANPKSRHKSTPSVSLVSPTEDAQYDSIEPMDSTPSCEVNQPLPPQVDGACDDGAFVASKEEGDERHEEKKQTPSITSESYCSLDSLESIQSEDGLLPSVTHIRQRLTSLEASVDDELTESSSDEEDGEDQPSARWRREETKRNWERTQASVESKWTWLQHRISMLNKELCRLDRDIQHRPSREHFTFAAASPNVSHPSYFALPNGTLLDQLHKGGNGSLLSAASAGLYKGVVTNSGRPGNGFGHNVGGGAQSQCLPHLLLPDSLIGTKLQVKDLLSPSPLGRNFVFVDEGGYSSARTRPLERRAHRKVVRKPKCASTRREPTKTCDSSEHPKLTLPHELPSRVLLDKAIKRITAEHSYAQLPLSKRRKAASSLSHLSTSRQLSFTPRYDYSFSTSPSPSGTPLSGSLDKGKGSTRKKLQLVHHHSTSSSTELQGPWSPNMSRPSTPTTMTTTPLQHPKRKRMLSSTPSFDIDNIVIPYSMASSTRLEKPEYKEIVTPSWREVMNGAGDEELSEKDLDLNHQEPPPKVNCEERDTESPLLSVDMEDEEGEEDLSDKAFSIRHEKCEFQEKKRFFNFVTGGQRKRSRPQSLTSTPDGSASGTSSPHPLSATKGKHHKRELMSPVPLEGDSIRHKISGILPWMPREFPLCKTDIDALHNPPPPPKPIRITPSPSPMHTRSSTPTDFKTPSSTSTLATPLSSPLSSTPSEESRVISPVEWMVINSQLHNGNGNHVATVNNQKHSDSSLPSSSIILKLAKRT